jgi:chaperonin GroES
MSCPIKAVDDRVVLIMDNTETVTKGGIVLPETVQEKGLRGKVVAVGPGQLSEESGKRIPIDGVQVGDVLYIRKHVGTKVEMDGETYLIVHEKDFLAVEVAAE